MAKTFFENFNEAEQIIVPSHKNPYSESNLPSMNSSSNSATWKERVAIPFSYRAKRKDGGRSYNTGILYLPAYETSKIRANGQTREGVTDIDIYGAEINGQSLNVSGFKKLFNDKNNSDFQFDIDTAQRAFQETYNRPARAIDVSGYKAAGSPFIRNLRTNLWGL